MIKGYIFDMDGTLLNSMPSWFKVCEEYVKKKGVKDYYKAKDLLKEYSIKEGSKIIKELFNFDISEDMIVKELLIDMFELYKSEVTLKDGVIDFLEKSLNEGKLMYLATATDRELTLKVIDYFNLKKYFLGVITVNETKRKTHPDIYLYCLDKMNLKKDEAIVFEDALYAIKTLYNNDFIVYGIKDDSEDSKDITKLVKKFIKDFKELC